MAALARKIGHGRYFDPRFQANVVKVLPGEHAFSQDPDEMLVTVLGSCVAACIRDRTLGIGGMNHFMLPESQDGLWGKASASMRYGNYAMERLINDILARGGRRDRLEIKLFGGCQVLVANSQIGPKNATFVEGYLREEGLPIASSFLRRPHPLRVHYFPVTGKAFVLELDNEEQTTVAQHEEGYRRALRTKPVPETDVELF